MACEELSLRRCQRSSCGPMDAKAVCLGLAVMPTRLVFLRCPAALRLTSTRRIPCPRVRNPRFPSGLLRLQNSALSSSRCVINLGAPTTKMPLPNCVCSQQPPNIRLRKRVVKHFDGIRIPARRLVLSPDRSAFNLLLVIVGGIHPGWN